MLSSSTKKRTTLRTADAHQTRVQPCGTGFKEGYGITESCSCIAAHPPDIYEYKYVYTLGAICASTPIKIIDDYGKEVNISQLAELLAEGL
ncbi:uncharacterized protein RAG0_02573 [Rhynchosporium agropyri]|uniref:Uncharacterized protein n=1 Tax=Rhynchosporium agropyri TaxID=914238 RepID=A0A1E1K1Q3_9HELO|nr:uncharacterized protein RAG0_02573 [Rhynchosporium agropyri]